MTSINKNQTLLMSLMTFMFVMLFMGVSEVQAAPNACVTKWQDLPKLKPLNGISDFDNKFREGRIQFTLASGKTFVIRERSGAIYAETPEGNANIEICKNSKSKITAIARTILGTKTIVVSHSGGKKFNIIDQNNPNSSVSATVQ